MVVDSYSLLMRLEVTMPKPTEKEPILTEFYVTERYIVKAKTIDEAQEMISSDCFEADAVEHLGIDVEPNF